MKYEESDIDKLNFKWFANDNTKQLLHEIQINKGKIRGLENIKIEFNYPIVAIAGKNGSGKSTVLALACCAFHNKKTGYNPKMRPNAYYTFSDFFIQTAEEIPPGGLKIWYKVAHNGWAPSEDLPQGEGKAYQLREKAQGGRWNNYQERIYRNVIFMGIDRVVPHSEKSVSKSYRKAFTDKIGSGIENDVAEAVGYILDKNYSTFKFKSHRNYQLPLVTSSGVVYSGFNMGAGESALFEIISSVIAAPTGSLIVIDEIELGLHDQAQHRLIQKLKELSFSKKCQIVCTTHSSKILGSLPPQARIYLETSGAKTRTISGISPEFASGKMSGIANPELELYVEDKIAEEIMLAAIPLENRSRVNITAIGSDSALTRQTAAQFKEKHPKNFMTIMDGDKQSTSTTNISNFQNHLEITKTNEQINWWNARVDYLPGNAPPEVWAITSLKPESIKLLSNEFGTDEETLENLIQKVKTNGPHTILRNLANELHLEINTVTKRIINRAVVDNRELFEPLLTKIVGKLS